MICLGSQIELQQNATLCKDRLLYISKHLDKVCWFSFPGTLHHQWEHRRMQIVQRARNNAWPQLLQPGPTTLNLSKVLRGTQTERRLFWLAPATMRCPVIDLTIYVLALPAIRNALESRIEDDVVIKNSGFVGFAHDPSYFSVRAA